MVKGNIVALFGISLLLACTFAPPLCIGAPANDAFTNSVHLSDTNLSYPGTLAGATYEPGEPQPNGTNTVWMSWEAPGTGSVALSMASAPQFQYYAVFQGSRVDQLQSVPVYPMYINSIYRFVATQGNVYHFQFSGGWDTFTFYLQYQPLDQVSNDDFANAQVVKGKNATFDPKSVVGATMELGEPAHMGGISQKSIWWKWQSPNWGNCSFDPRGSLATNYVIAIYTGNSVETLTLQKKATNGFFSFPVNGGQTYFIAAAVPSSTVADIRNTLQVSPNTGAHSVPGNILQEPSWEGTFLNPTYWGKSGSIGGYVGQSGGADGTTWPEVGTGAQVWQDFSTVPGHTYTICFAYLIGGQLSGGSVDAQVAVLWDTSQIGISSIPKGETGFWHWDTYTVLASNTTSRITFHNVALARNVEMDAFSVVDSSAGPTIVTQPASVSSIVGGTASFVVGVNGTLPLSYRWFFNGSPLNEQTNNMLVLAGLATNQVGNYFAVVTNSFGAVTSSIASLLVDAPTSATILSQPYGGVVPVGGYFNFSVVAAGTPPLRYQWFFEGNAIAGATNRNLALNNVRTNDGGAYTVRVQTPSSTAWSLPAVLTVTTSDIGGGTIDFRNKFGGVVTNGAPVFDLNGVTPLNGSNYAAQLYAGPSLALLRPAGQPTPFQQGFNAGYFYSQIITLANVPPGGNAVVQVRAWDAAFGTSYEEVRALGGRVGKSQVFQVTAGGNALPAASLTGLQSFSLQAGLPYFQVGTIAFVERQPQNLIIWALHGQPGYLYSIEKLDRRNSTIWQPYTVVTNVTGSVNFSDSANSGSAVVFYRGRILD